MNCKTCSNNASAPPLCEKTLFVPLKTMVWCPCIKHYPSVLFLCPLVCGINMYLLWSDRTWPPKCNLDLNHIETKLESIYVWSHEWCPYNSMAIFFIFIVVLTACQVWCTEVLARCKCTRWKAMVNLKNLAISEQWSQLSYLLTHGGMRSLAVLVIVANWASWPSSHYRHRCW